LEREKYARTVRLIKVEIYGDMMIDKIGNRKITLTQRELKDNEKHCEKCDGIGWLYVERDNEKFIQKCPTCDNGIIHVCSKCGQELGKYTSCYSEQCVLHREYEREMKRYEKATKYTLENVPKESCEYFYFESYEYNNGYFDDIDSLEEFCKENEIDMPKFIWGTKKKELSIDAYSVVNNALEEWYEDAFDNVNDTSLSELQDCLDKFCKTCGVGDCYDVDYKVCIELF